MKKALVIDDSRQPADVLCKLLTLFDMRARAAYGARAGILALREEIPDIIFLDISMPGVDGFEVLAYMKREPRLAHVPVVVITGDDAPETAHRARNAGALDVIVKPATVDALEKVLQAAKLA
jgi:CheY-like chemotaxis protein